MNSTHLNEQKNKQTNRQRARKRSQSQNFDKTEMKSLDPFSKQIEQFNIGICRGIPESPNFLLQNKGNESHNDFFSSVIGYSGSRVFFIFDWLKRP